MFSKKYKHNLLYKIGWKKPDFREKKRGEYRIWIHAVSLGETKASFTLLDEIEKEFPNADIVFSTTTQTGQEEAKKRVEKVFYLPLDFSWLMKPLVRRIDPDLFILIETDFWYNLLRELKAQGVRTALVNGKISQNSHKNFKKFKKFAKTLFSMIGCFCVQSNIDKERFIELGVEAGRIAVTGNIKFDGRFNFKPAEKFLLDSQKKIITIASTHETEEEMILDQLERLGNQDQICYLLAPRHPERFKKISRLLERRKIPFRTIDQKGTGDERIVLINRMGILDECYARSTAVIMGGSFIPTVGGHNIYEAIRHGIPVIYGPFMHKQESIVNLVANLPICTQIPLEKLSQTLQKIIFNPQKNISHHLLNAHLQGASERSWKYLKQNL